MRNRITGIKMLDPRPAVGGYVKIGRTVEGKGQRGTYTRPEKHDHFEITTTERVKQGQAENYAPDLELMQRLVDAADTFEPPIPLCNCKRAKDLGFPNGLPTRLPVVFPSDDLDAIVPTRLAYYRGRRAYCHGDGEQALRWKTEGSGKDVKYLELEEYGPCGEACPDFQEGRCKPSGLVKLVLPWQQRVGTIYQIATTSWGSLRGIIGGLEWVKEVAGTVSWIPLFLELRLQKNDKGTSYIMGLYFPGTPQQLLASATEEWRSLSSGKREMAQLLSGLEDEETTPDEFTYVDGDTIDVSTGEVVSKPDEPGEEAPDGPEQDPSSATDPVDADGTPSEGEIDAAILAMPKEELIALLLSHAKHFMPAGAQKVGDVDLLAVMDHVDYDDALDHRVRFWINSVDLLEKGDRDKTLPRPKAFAELVKNRLMDRLADEEEARQRAQHEAQSSPPEDPPHPADPEPENELEHDGSAEDDDSASWPAWFHELDPDQAETMKNMGWNGQEEPPTLTPPQCQLVIDELKSIGKTQRDECLSFLTSILGRPIGKTSEIVLHEFLTIQHEVEQVRNPSDGEPPF